MRLAGAVAILLATVSCGGARYMVSRPLQFTPVVAPEARVSSHVILVSIDGLRPDAIGRFAAPTLQRLMREGSYSLTARTIMPSKTLPSHTSMLTGEPPDEHHVLWNHAMTARTGVVEVPTVFSVAREHGYRTAAFFSKAKFHALQRPGTLDYSQAPGGWFGRWSSDRMVTDVTAHLETARPNLLFLHLSEPDVAGHSEGWMGDAYGRAVARADAAVGDVLAAAQAAYGAGNYSVIITADHGGHGRDHGTDDPRDVLIPWIAWGRGVGPGELDVPINTFDTAPTVLWLLGVPYPSAWNGNPVTSAFLAPALRAAN